MGYYLLLMRTHFLISLPKIILYNNISCIDLNGRKKNPGFFNLSKPIKLNFLNNAMTQRTIIKKSSDEFNLADNHQGLSASAGSFQTKSDCARKKRVQRDTSGDGLQPCGVIVFE